jgi:hypothetical protein
VRASTVPSPLIRVPNFWLRLLELGACSQAASPLHSHPCARHHKTQPFISPSHEALNNIAPRHRKSPSEYRFLVDCNLVSRSEYSDCFYPRPACTIVDLRCVSAAIKLGRELQLRFHSIRSIRLSIGHARERTYLSALIALNPRQNDDPFAFPYAGRLQ